MYVVWNRHQPCHDRVSPLGKEWKQGYGCNYVHGESRVVLQKVLVPAEWQAYLEASGERVSDAVDNLNQ